MLFSFIILSILLFRFLTIQNYRLHREDFAEEFVKMENDLSDFALSYFDFSKYADDLFDTDFWYKDGYVFRNE